MCKELWLLAPAKGRSEKRTGLLEVGLVGMGRAFRRTARVPHWPCVCCEAAGGAAHGRATGRKTERHSHLAAKKKKKKKAKRNSAHPLRSKKEFRTSTPQQKRIQDICSATKTN